ncbi:hypothetical protein FXB41_07130 [Bradyrhizobium canariense]|nr:hypothetical protein [Bradyrhizobium canariense]MBW5434557.1 hypothetical protein [Bradyrhizobium canariense]
MVTALKENPTPELGSHRALEAADLALGSRPLDGQLIEGSPERPQVSLNMLLASFGVEGEDEVHVTLDIGGAAEVPREQQDLCPARSDLDVKRWRWWCRRGPMTCRDGAKPLFHATPASS